MKILVIGGDSRMKYTAAALGAEIYSASTVGAFDIIVLPMPLTRDGETIFTLQSKIPFDVIRQFAASGSVVFAGGECPALAEMRENCGLVGINYAKYEPLVLKNAALTAEAAVCVLSESTERSLFGSRTLITGYGRIASMLGKRLGAFGAEVTVSARREEQRVQAGLDGFRTVSIEQIPDVISEFDYIVNTVPAAVFDEDAATKMHGVFLELATLPNKAPDNPEIKYIHGGGLPGRHYPKTAGEYIAAAVNEIYTNRKEKHYERYR